jgi:hypothetical protein
MDISQGDTKDQVATIPRGDPDMRETRYIRHQQGIPHSVQFRIDLQQQILPHKAIDIRLFHKQQQIQNMPLPNMRGISQPGNINP